MRKHSVALGIYQRLEAADQVIGALKERGFHKFALIENREGKLYIQRGLWGWLHAKWVMSFSQLVVQGEILIAVQADLDYEKEIVEILREVGSGHPASFLFRPPLGILKDSLTLPKTPLTLDELKGAAEVLAAECSAVREKKGCDQRLLKRLQQADQVIEFLRDDIALTEHIEETTTNSAEWLLDNMYVIKGSIDDIKKNLPKAFYRELPKLINGLPRIYIIADAIVKGTAGKLSRENISAFLKSYQAIHPLKIGELWALPLMLKLALIEAITLLAVRVDQYMREGQQASFWGNRLLHASHREPKRVADFLQRFEAENNPPSPHFAEELLGHLFDEQNVVDPIKKWLEGKFKTPLAEVLHKEQMQQTIEQVNFSSCIVSLITLSQLSWPDIFEEVSVVDAVLRKDPTGIYPKMNFATRDRYRQAVENLARYSQSLELHVAEQALKLAMENTGGVEQHIGYYLVDQGRISLEETIHFRPPFLKRIQRFIKGHPALVYIGAIGLATVLILVGLGALGLPWYLLLFGFIPASELAVQLINTTLVKILPARLLCKMDYSKGIPEACKTLVVVPSLLILPEDIKEELYHLEIRYLANMDPALSFALFTDFKDAHEKCQPEDAALLQQVINGLRELEAKYGPRFFLFHRERQWSEGEKKWIGWERKRGKIETLNRFLMGEKLDENIVYYGQSQALVGTKYVITLDADTQLPKDKGKELIEVISHPLNYPILDAEQRRLKRGYTLIQPRISTDYSQTKSTFFSLIFSEPYAMDPYTHAISNVYQDLTQEGTYHGKGIYDVAAFYQILSGRYPIEHLLSHDLLEGAYARVGFASDISLWDSYPENYLSWAVRQDRWIRGDFQIIDWLFPYVPSRNGKKEANPLSAMNRWKIFDNLRRALITPSLAFFLLNAWLFSGASGVATLFALGVSFLPVLLLSLTGDMQSLTNAFLRSMFAFALIPYETQMFLDSLLRVVYRRAISHQNLLQWTPSSKKIDRGLPPFLKLGGTIFISAVIALAIDVFNSRELVNAIAILSLWALSPIMVFLLNRPIAHHLAQGLSTKDKRELYHTARLTWRFFDDFMKIETHYLPPDNYQVGLKVEVADRTSPTNIGLGLIAIQSGYDLHFIPFDEYIGRLEHTVDTLKQLERYKGHFLNWYNTTHLNPLYPRYISTVDSGNLLACFWTLEEGILEALSQPLLPLTALEGLKVVAENTSLSEIKKELQKKPANVAALIEILHRLARHLSEVKLLGNPEDYWVARLKEEVTRWEQMVERYFSYPDPMPLSLLELAHGQADSETQAKCQWLAGEMVARSQRLIQEIRRLGDEMDFRFLYNEERKLYSIGYNLDEQRIDSSYYDLLASEARIASLVGIAKGDLPIEHWWSLGRGYTRVGGHPVLLSWGGTMFEYLMPLIFNKHYRDSLLGETCKGIVRAQKKYGDKRGIPWGISEAAYSAIDAHKTYQYRSFGIPEVGLKRGLEEDLVVSPYSTALALNVDAALAMQNLYRLKNAKGPYGYYESIDYTRQRDPSGIRGVLIYAYMAHHQGMILASIDNVLNDNILQKRFHDNPRIAGVEALLYERIPKRVPVRLGGISQRIPLKRLMPFSTQPLYSVSDTPFSVIPKISLLSNGAYSIGVTNTGGSFSTWRGVDISRFRADFTRDNWGNFYYIKDVDHGEIWSTGYQPTLKNSPEFAISLKPDKAEFKRRDHQIECINEIFVSPEDNVEVALITLINHDSRVRNLELTSYIELCLAPRSADKAHPAFNKMFIETSYSMDPLALLATRRLRSPDEAPLWAIHLLATSEKDEFHYETDRRRFIGRGRSTQNPIGVEKGLSDNVTSGLDPIFSWQKKVTLTPDQRFQMAFVTGIGITRDEVLAIGTKYKDLEMCQRTLELSWNYTQLELRHLRIHLEEAQLFQNLAARILYPHMQLRPSSERLKRNRLGQQGLWAQGISGDLPMVVVMVDSTAELDFVREMLVAHMFWSLRGLKVDLVILNEEGISYEHPLQDNLQRMILAHVHQSQPETPGGVFIRNSAKIDENELRLILCMACVVLRGARGPLRQQLVAPLPPANFAKWHVPTKNISESISRPLPFLELPYFNGLGGYSPDGKEYIIYLGPGTELPAPWINVIANPEFGTLVSEAGLGTTWYGNSQSNRLTPWSNDPVVNPIVDAIYIRDDDLGTYWTPTPAPIRELDAYRTTHGQGYSRFEHNSHGIEQELQVFVPLDLPLRIQRLTLWNHSEYRRFLSLTSYAEWVLGSDPSAAILTVYTEWDEESQAIFAYNHAHPDFGNHVAFCTSVALPSSYTGDRTEFIGRSHSTQEPEGLHREHLSKRVGAGIDPCAAIQCKVEIAPGQKGEAIFIMGYAPNEKEARRLIQLCREEGQIEALFLATKKGWDKLLGTIEVETPDLSLNFMLNRWLPYQTLSCRLWGRTAFYQSSGAFGFRDQLQDTMLQVYLQPEKVREYILYAASRQFVEGDVQHWWHPQSGGGVRTRFSDDRLWLPFVVAHYCKVTGDRSILKEEIAFLTGLKLGPGQHELYFVPTAVAAERGTLLEHCRRAIDISLSMGQNGLPLMGGGDWNDGMNRVGIEGKGESVWLAWFLVRVLQDFAELVSVGGEEYIRKAEEIVNAVEREAWDGSWYRRAYFDDGSPMGAKGNSECAIDSIAQSWAVLAGLADATRVEQALKSAEEFLIRPNEKLALLLTPPFDHSFPNPGYIMGYLPGVRENGAQYTHGTQWLALAFARQGNGEKAAALLKMMHPISHTQNKEAADLFRLEPYVLAADIYSSEPYIGRGGWSWYTGSSAWMWRIWIEEILGFKLVGNIVTFDPKIPSTWEGFTLQYRFKSTLYIFRIVRGNLPANRAIQLHDDGKTHQIDVILQS